MMPERLQALLGQESSEVHTRLREFVRRRVEAADRRWSQRYDRWRESERLYRAFRPADEQDLQRKDAPLTEGVTKIVVPYGYAVIQSTLAFFMQVFTQRNPVIPVEPMGPADARAAILMEALLDRQMNAMDPTGVMVLYQWLLDSLRYGVGIVKNLWVTREWPDLVRQVGMVMDPFTGQPQMQDTLTRRVTTAYEGNEAMNVSPFNFLPDPNRPLAEFQKGEFVCHRVRRSWTELRQKQAEGMYVGIQHIPRRTSAGYGYGSSVAGGGGWGGSYPSDASRIVDMDEGPSDYLDAYGEPYVELIEMWAYVDPAVMGLEATPGGGPHDEPTDADMEQPTPASFFGGTDTGDPYARRAPATGTPELWVFTVANWSRVIRAEPANLPGHRFPFEVVELNYDVHSPANHGMIETFRGLQYILSWLFNSRMLSVERTINNEYVYDPSMIEELDVLDPGPGRLIRLKEQAWNSGKLGEALTQLPVNDFTQSHHSDAKVVTDLIEIITGANRNIMGLPNTGRRAATEVQGQMNLSAGRMKMMIEIVSQQGLRHWAHQMARNTQAFTSEMGLRLKPPYDQVLGAPFVQVSPQMLMGEFLFPFSETGMPTDRLFEANTFKELLMMGIQSGAAAPLLQTFPWVQLLGRMLRALNIKDLQSWGLSLPQLVMQPDEQVQAQMQQGNLVPGQMGEAGGQARDGFARPPAGSTPNGNAHLSGR